MGNFRGEVESGDRRRALEALRGRLVSALEEAEAREVAPLARQMALVLRELDELKEPEGSTIDDLRARRAARIASASGSHSS